MSKFFSNDNSDDDFDQQPEQTQEEPKFEQVVNKKKVQKKPQNQKNQFDSSDEEEEHRKILTEKDKRFGEMQNIVKQINNSFKNYNFVQMYDDFEQLNKCYAKSSSVISKEGIPQFYLIICSRIENLVNTMSSADKKKLNTSNNKSYNILKQKIKKNNQNIRTQIDELKQKSPNLFDSDQEEEEQEVKQKKAEDDSDFEGIEADQQNNQEQSDDDFWGEGEDEGDQQKGDSDEDSQEEGGDDIPIEERRCRWLKYEFLPEWYKKKYNKKFEKYEEKAEKEDQTQQTFVKKQGDQKNKTKDWDKIGQIEQSAIQIELTPDQINKKVREIVENRGKKQLNLKIYYDVLTTIHDYYQNQPLNKLEIILVLLPLRYDLSKIRNPTFMERTEWIAQLKNIIDILTIIKNSKESSLQKLRTFNKDGEEFYPVNIIYDILVSQSETLDNELNKAMKQLDPGSLDQVYRIHDLKEFLKFIKQCQQHFEEQQDNNRATKLALLRLENIYYIHDNLLEKQRQIAQQKGLSIKDYYFEETDTKALIHKLSTMVYRFSDAGSRLKAILYQVYHLSIHNHYYQAKDYLLMSHVQDLINSSNDITIQALYNRVIVQIGLCAFRLGLIQESQSTLQEICQSTKLKELISQGVSRNIGTVEKEERRRLLPFQMHINTDIVDISYYIVSMLLEIPNFAQQDSNEINKRVISKQFRILLAFYERQHFVGKAEQYKDFIYAASNELLKGNWESCYENLLNINNFWNIMQYGESVKQIIKQRVQEYALRCYLLNFKNCLECISFEHLQQRFCLEERVVIQIISKMIHHKEIQGSIDESCIVIESQESSKLQKLSMNLAEKLNGIVSHNEKILDGKYGNYGFSDTKTQQVGDDTTTYKKKNYKKKGVFVKAHNFKQQQNKYKYKNQNKKQNA